MKGLVFREFLGMVEKEYGYEIVDQIIENSNLPSRGIYTSVGTYDHAEIFALLTQLSQRTGISVDEHMFSFGKFVFSIFQKSYPLFFKNKKNSFELLNDVESVIHVEVLKLYPEAELPRFETKRNGSDQMEMIYRSDRKMSNFAEGLIVGCLDYFNEKASIEKQNLTENGSEVLFKITKVE